MYYPVIGILAIIVLFIENYDILFLRKMKLYPKAYKSYKMFLFAVLAYYVSDVAWGIIEYNKNISLLYASTVIYFICMACGIVFFSKYAVDYLDEYNKYGRLLKIISMGFLVATVVLMIINAFIPICFTIDENCVYNAGIFRYVMLIVQITLFVLVAIYAIIQIFKCDKSLKLRYQTIANVGLIVAIFLTIQIWNPYLPLYSIAYLTGTCMLHTFVINSEKDQYKIDLEESMEREKKQYEELKTARDLAYTDALTGASSKLAFIELEEKIDYDIRNNKNNEFAIAVFDVNNLKMINDKYGHEYGDKFIIESYNAINNYFTNVRFIELVEMNL